MWPSEMVIPIVLEEEKVIQGLSWSRKEDNQDILFVCPLSVSGTKVISMSLKPAPPVGRWHHHPGKKPGRHFGSSLPNLHTHSNHQISLILSGKSFLNPATSLYPQCTHPCLGHCYLSLGLLHQFPSRWPYRGPSAH